MGAVGFFLLWVSVVEISPLVPFPPLVRYCAVVFEQAAGVIQRHWVEAESTPEGEDDAATNNQVASHGGVTRDLWLSRLLGLSSRGGSMHGAQPCGGFTVEDPVILWRVRAWHDDFFPPEGLLTAMAFLSMATGCR